MLDEAVGSGLRVASLQDIPCGEGIEISREVTGTEDDIAILRDEDGAVWALNNTCTHEVAALAEGWVEGGYVECPLHSSKFCLRTGAVESMPATLPVVPHRIEVREGGVYLYPGESP